MPISIEDTVQVDRWEETTTYNGTPQTKTKQSVFTTVKVKYLLLHESGESLELMGYGHGADTMDKAAGKATTYALKNCLLYTFLTPVGAMDDTDTQHSDEMPAKPIKQAAKQTPAPAAAKPKTEIKHLPRLTPDSEKWDEAVNAVKSAATSIATIRKYYSLTDENETLLINQINK